MEIWKFEIPTNDYTVELPSIHRVLSAGVQGSSILVWVLVDPKDSKKVKRRLPVYGTGHTILESDENLPLINTVFMGPMVFHVFDGGVKEKS